MLLVTEVTVMSEFVFQNKSMEYDHENEIIMLNEDERRAMRMTSALGVVPVCALMEIKLSVRDHLALNRSIQKERRAANSTAALFSLKRYENILSQAYEDLENIERTRWSELYDSPSVPEE